MYRGTFGRAGSVGAAAVSTRVAFEGALFCAWSVATWETNPRAYTFAVRAAASGVSPSAVICSSRVCSTGAKLIRPSSSVRDGRPGNPARTRSATVAPLASAAYVRAICWPKFVSTFSA